MLMVTNHSIARRNAHLLLLLKGRTPRFRCVFPPPTKEDIVLPGLWLLAAKESLTGQSEKRMEEEGVSPLTKPDGAEERKEFSKFKTRRWLFNHRTTNDHARSSKTIN